MATPRIAVIGAGASGLTAAYQLKQRGYGRIVVFEKDDVVGGKVRTQFHEGRPYELGAVWVMRDYRFVNGLADKLDVPRFAAKPLDIIDPHGNVRRTPLHLLKKFGPIDLTRAAMKFWTTIRRHPQIKNCGFHGFHPDFHLTLDETSRKHGFVEITQAMAPTMSACGYGYYEEVPALYWLKLMSFLFDFALRGAGLFGELRSFSNGFQSLWIEVAKGLDVRTGVGVDHLRRYREGNRDKVEITAGGEKHTFDKVIVSAPLETARNFMDLSDEERDLFGRIRTCRYVVTQATSDQKAHAAFSRNVTPQRLGHVNTAAKYYDDSSLCTYYQIVSPSTTNEQALETLRADLANVDIHLGELHTQKAWSYFPHVGSDDLRDGFYEKIDALQGRRGTFYVGALMGFETVEHTAAFADDLVRRFF